MVSIHEIDTELLPEQGASAPEGERRPEPDREQLRELIRELLREELERFLRLEARP